MLKITGFAAPFGVPNAYGEILDADTFKAWFNTPQHAHIEMKSQHSQHAGYWEKIWADDVGIWCEGVIVCPKTIAWAKRLRHRELSISYGETGHDDYSAPLNWTLMRFAEQMDTAGFPLPPPFVIAAAKDALRHGKDFHIGPDTVHIEPTPYTIKHVDHFDEISLTDSGAYPGTHFDFV